MRDWRHWNDVSLRLIAQLVRLIPSAGPCSASKSRHSVQTPSAVQIRVSLAVSSHPPSAKNCFFSTRLFAPAHFLSGQQGLREPKAYTLLLRRSGRRLGPSASARSSTRSSGGPSTLVARGGWGHVGRGQCWQPPAALRQTACPTSDASSLKPLWPAEPAVLCKTVVEPGLVPNGAHRR